MIMNDETKDQTKKGKIRCFTKIRLNVLFLFLIAYLSLGFLFCILTFFWPNETGQNPKEAFMLIKDPLLVLLGGTIAVVKDLVH